MRLDYIRSFINVVNCKSFSVAAKKAFVSQPTISTHIKQLEADLEKKKTKRIFQTSSNIRTNVFLLMNLCQKPKQPAGPSDFRVY